MCGRVSLTASPEEIEEAFGLETAPAVTPRYNIAPSEPMLAVRPTDAGTRETALLRWGLVRPGSEEAKAPINLPIEIAARGALRGTLRERRCIIPLTGFYEWKRAGKAKQPFNVRRKDGKVFGVAGLWERLESGDGNDLESCLVLTTAANDVVRPIHDRMPVILDPASYSRWLVPPARGGPELMAAFQHLSEDLLESYPVSPLVNRAGVEDPRCLERVKEGTLW
jgi:putative SOS response-associated peptidase YedK